MVISIGEESIVSLVDENKLSDIIRKRSQIYPQSYCGATMDAVWNSLLFSSLLKYYFISRAVIFVFDNITIKAYLNINFAIRPCIPEVVSSSQN